MLDNSSASAIIGTSADVGSLTKFVPERRTATCATVMKFSTGLGERQARFVATDGSVDRMGDIVEPRGGTWRNYLSNPIVLLNHSAENPIARTINIGLVEDSRGARIEATVEFPPEGTSTTSDEACRLVKAGVLNAMSIGFLPTERGKLLPNGGARFTKWELCELSIVAVGANSNAIVVERALTDETNAQMRQRLRTFLDTIGRDDGDHRTAPETNAEMRVRLKAFLGELRSVD